MLVGLCSSSARGSLAFPAQVTWAILIARCCVFFHCLGDISLTPSGAKTAEDQAGADMGDVSEQRLRGW